jgi:hypothetical protein
MNPEPELRDIYAMFAMSALMTRNANMDARSIAAAAFDQADAMLWQREKGESDVDKRRATASNRRGQKNDPSRQAAVDPIAEGHHEREGIEGVGKP